MKLFKVIFLLFMLLIVSSCREYPAISNNESNMETNNIDEKNESETDLPEILFFTYNYYKKHHGYYITVKGELCYFTLQGEELYPYEGFEGYRILKALKNIENKNVIETIDISELYSFYEKFLSSNNSDDDYYYRVFEIEALEIVGYNCVVGIKFNEDDEEIMYLRANSESFASAIIDPNGKKVLSWLDSLFMPKLRPLFENEIMLPDGSVVEE